MKDMILEVGDVRWAYSDKTGAIPFIINNEETKVKQLDDGFVLCILNEHKCKNPVNSALKTLSDYYEQEMELVVFGTLMQKVTTLQKLLHFGNMSTSYGMPLTMAQVDFLTKNYNKKKSKENEYRARLDAMHKTYEEAHAESFEF